MNEQQVRDFAQQYIKEHYAVKDLEIDTCTALPDCPAWEVWSRWGTESSVLTVGLENGEFAVVNADGIELPRHNQQ